MYQQINGLFLDSTTADAIRETESIIRAFTHVEKPAVSTSPKSHSVTGRSVNAAGLPRMDRMYQLVLAGYSNADAVAVIRAEYESDTPSASIAWVRQSMKPTSSKYGYAQKVLARLQ